MFGFKSQRVGLCRVSQHAAVLQRSAVCCLTSSLNNVQKLLVVNAGRIAHEARVDTEPSLDRTVRKNLLHDIVLALDLEEIRRLVLLERDRGINAGSAAGGRRAAAGTVGETSVGDDASVAKILPRMVQVAPVAALVARVAAHLHTGHVKIRLESVYGWATLRPVYHLHVICVSNIYIGKVYKYSTMSSGDMTWLILPIEARANRSPSTSLAANAQHEPQLK